jgi:hypothetical protein
MTRVCTILVLALLAGCAASDQLPTAKVTGKVTYKGKPVPTGTIMFIPEGDKPSATGELKSDGTYELTTYEEGDGAVLGKHSIEINALEDMAGKLPEQRSGTPSSLIPDKYSNRSTSNLSAEVEDVEVNTIDFELKD